MKRHQYEVVRRMRIGGDPMVKRCKNCGKTMRHFRGRWTVTYIPKNPCR